MSSENIPRRKPRQQRGEQRMAAMLDAAAAVFAQSGFDAATMTAIAERSGSSIGALYQYFPNKLALARALREQYGEEMAQGWSALIADAAQLSVAALADRVFDLMIGFFDAHPAYLTLLNATLGYQRNADARQRLRAQLGAALREKKPEMDEAEALRTAKVALQIVKGLNPLYAEASAAERRALVAEFKLALQAYLKLRLHK
ncbi:AcrR family transcriptional regulator [Duganella sp. 1224]|uniref:TetR/AcrR family transcriptional regulator n=1 Tax=Duganella sp. 1224 TaxID=2587052 RepID=UPI001834A756|nr:TetR/AcrR family transcriptional regulator [Duganella sp. 1224]NYE59268.1 AcrR family transcriptional regulator [Duganella sp. 1224]